MPSYSLPTLPYAYDALEPHFDEETMRIHHTKHHNTYVTKLNELLINQPDLNTLAVDDVVARLSQVPAKKRQGVRNHGGGHANHSFFWKMLAPASSTTLDGNLKNAIEKQFGSFEAFKKEFEAAATTVFGSGWAWLVLKDDDVLAVVTTPNQDSPLMGQDIVGASAGYPIIGLDVWVRCIVNILLMCIR
jgi:superoxide dismutase, Fe-Mn family